MKQGFLIISHGSPHASWINLVDQAVQEAELPDGVPVEVVFLEIVDGRLIQDGLDRLAAQGVTDFLVIPFFVSSGSKHVEEIAYALGVKRESAVATELAPFNVQGRVHFGEPMDSEPDELARIIVDKHGSTVGSQNTDVLLIVGHGSKLPIFHERWVDGLERIARTVRTLGDFAEVDTALLLPDQMYDKIIQWQQKTDLIIRVVPLFLSAGYFTKRVIPERIGQAECVYNGEPLLPHPLLSRWLGRQAQALLNITVVVTE